MGEWGTGREGGRALDLWCQVSVPPILSPLVEPSCLQVRVGAWSKRRQGVGRSSWLTWPPLEKNLSTSCR